MIWAWIALLLVSTLSLPGDVVVQDLERVETSLRECLPEGTALDEALTVLGAFRELRGEASARAEGYAVRFEELLALPGARKSEFRALLEELNDERRRSWEQQLDARERLLRTIGAPRWEFVFPTPAR